MIRHSTDRCTGTRFLACVSGLPRERLTTRLHCGLSLSSPVSRATTKGQSVDPTDPTCRCHMLQARAIIGPMCCPDGSSQGFTAGLAGPVELRPRHSCHINCAPIIQLKAHCLAGSMTSAGLAVAASHPSRWQACSLNRGHFVGSELRAVPSLNRLNLSKKDPPTGVSL